jgi:hypothetical protein
MSRRSGTPRKLLGAAEPSACAPAEPGSALELSAWLWHVTTGGGTSTASSALLSALRCRPLSSTPCGCLRVRAPNIPATPSVAGQDRCRLVLFPVRAEPRNMAPTMPPAAVAAWLEMRESFEKGAWRVLPVYPYGHVLVQDHRPAMAVVPVCVLVIVAAGLRRLLRRLGIAAGRAVVTADIAPTVDWDRLGDIAYFTCCHLLLTAFFACYLRHEAAGWLASWHQLWDFWQPPLSPALWWYYAVQMALTTESCLHMLRGLATNGGRDLPMLIHHAATL